MEFQHTPVLCGQHQGAKRNVVPPESPWTKIRGKTYSRKYELGMEFLKCQSDQKFSFNVKTDLDVKNWICQSIYCFNTGSKYVILTNFQSWLGQRINPTKIHVQTFDF